MSIVNKPIYYEVTFNYEEECRRIDAPKEDMCIFLEQKALEVATNRYGRVWEVVNTTLRQGERDTLVVVKLKLLY